MSDVLVEGLSTEVQLWRHGYRTGWDDHVVGITPLAYSHLAGADTIVLEAGGVTRRDFWQHGYRTGLNDREAGRTHLLDDPPGDTLADVIPMLAKSGAPV